MTLRLLFTMYLLATLNASLLAQNDQDEIKDCFKQYKEAILAQNGNEAVGLASTGTINYYQKMLDMALKADSSAVEKLGLIDKLTVLAVRHKLSKEEVAGHDGKSFFVYAVDNGLAGKKTVQSAELGEVQVSQKTAKGIIVVNGQTSEQYFEFFDEGGWKIDMNQYLASTNESMAEVVKMTGMSEHQFLGQVLQSLTGNAPDNSIWQPLQ